ncbi:MAG: hypothetical protein ACK5PF_08380 [bacterium]
MNLDKSQLERLGKRSGAALTQPEAPKAVVAPPKPDPVLAAVSELGRAVRDLPAMLPPAKVIEVPVPAAINADELGRAIAAALGKSSTKPVSWSFKVKRDVDGLIESIEATPRT